MRRLKKLQKLDGFTMLDLMITLAVIAILVAIALPDYHRFQEKVMLAEGDLLVSTMIKGSTVFRANFDRDPTLQELSAEMGWRLVMAPSNNKGSVMVASAAYAAAKLGQRAVDFMAIGEANASSSGEDDNPFVSADPQAPTYQLVETYNYNDGNIPWIFFKAVKPAVPNFSCYGAVANSPTIHYTTETVAAFCIDAAGQSYQGWTTLYEAYLAMGFVPGV